MWSLRCVLAGCDSDGQSASLPTVQVPQLCLATLSDLGIWGSAAGMLSVPRTDWRPTNPPRDELPFLSSLPTHWEAALGKDSHCKTNAGAFLLLSPHPTSSMCLDVLIPKLRGKPPSFSGAVVGDETMSGDIRFWPCRSPLPSPSRKLSGG